MNNDTGSISSLKNEVKRLKEMVSSMMGDTQPLYKKLEFQKGELTVAPAPSDMHTPDSQIQRVTLTK